MKPHDLRGPRAVFAALVLWLSAARMARAEDPSASSTRWDFESVEVERPPAGFSFPRTGGGRPGRWVVKAEEGAPSGTHVLAQVDDDTFFHRFPMAIAAEPVLADLRLSVRCKPVSGRIDQACGLVFRYLDANRYYLVRANALEHNVRLYAVVDGVRHQLDDWDGPVSSRVWHELRAEALGDHLRIVWDGQWIMDVHDATHAAAGKIGLWTKSDSVTAFDDLTLDPLLDLDKE